MGEVILVVGPFFLARLSGGRVFITYSDGLLVRPFRHTSSLLVRPTRILTDWTLVQIRGAGFPKFELCATSSNASTYLYWTRPNLSHIFYVHDMQVEMRLIRGEEVLGEECPIWLSKSLYMSSECIHNRREEKEMRCVCWSVNFNLRCLLCLFTELGISPKFASPPSSPTLTYCENGGSLPSSVG